MESLAEPNTVTIENFTPDDKIQAAYCQQAIDLILNSMAAPLDEEEERYLISIRKHPYPGEDGIPREIYVIENTINGKLYVGQTKYTAQSRWREHIKDSRRRTEKKSSLHQAIQKYGRYNFVVETVFHARNKQEADEMEQVYIFLLKSYEPHRGYNLSFGGQGVYPTEVVKQKLRDFFTTHPNGMKGRNHTPEARAKMSAAHKGKKHSAVHRQNLGNVNRARWAAMTDEQKQTFREGAKRWRASQKQINN